MIAIGSDHGGFKLKQEIIKYFNEIDLEYEDFGTDSEERTDYPIYAKQVAEVVSKNKSNLGILICRSGDGMAIVANKFKGVRAAKIEDEESAIHVKADDDVNVICLSGDKLNLNSAVKVIRAWIGTEFKGGRYLERIKMIEDIEKDNLK